jgi:hypothetical protein
LREVFGLKIFPFAHFISAANIALSKMQDFLLWRPTKYVFVSVTYDTGLDHNHNIHTGTKITFLSYIHYAETVEPSVQSIN